MIVAIVDGRIVAHADLVTECVNAVTRAGRGPRADQAPFLYRAASPALQAAIERGHSPDSLEILVGPGLAFLAGPESAYLTPADSDIRTIREHVLAKALENTK